MKDITMTTPTPEPAAAPVAPVPATSPRTTLRVYVLGLVAAVLGAVVPIAEASAGDMHWSAAWFAALGVAVFVPAVTAGLHYLAEHNFPLT